MARRFGRPTRREQQQLVNSGHRAWGAAFGKPEVAESLCTEIKPVRHRGPAGASGRPLEKNVLAAVLQALRADPRVALCERQQSGVFMEGNRHIRVGSKGAADIKGMLVGGKYFEVECKRDERTKPTAEQLERIATIRANGGVAGWAWSAESALALLPC